MHRATDAPPPRRWLAAVGAADTWEDTPAVRREARGRRVARDLVELSRLQNGAERAERTPVDLPALLRAIACDYSGVVVEGPARLQIESDSRRLARVLFALIDNAHLHGAPPVRISYDATAIVVEDGGGGFPPRVLERAPAPFVTGDRFGRPRRRAWARDRRAPGRAARRRARAAQCDPRWRGRPPELPAAAAD